MEIFVNREKISEGYTSIYPKKIIINSIDDIKKLKEFKEIDRVVGEVFVDHLSRKTKRANNGKSGTVYNICCFQQLEKEYQYDSIFGEKIKIGHYYIGYFYSQKREAKKIGLKFRTKFINAKEQDKFLASSRIKRIN